MRALRCALVIALCVFVVSVVAEEKFKPLAILDAEALMNTQKLSEAKTELDTFVTENTDSEWRPLAQFLLLKCDYEAKNDAAFHSGVSVLHASQPSHTYLAELLYLEGSAYARAGEKELAKAKYRDVIANHPKSPFVVKAQDRLLKMIFDEGKRAEFSAEVANVRATNPNHPNLGDFAYLEGIQFINTHEPGAALAKFTAVVDTYTTSTYVEKAKTMKQFAALLTKVTAISTQDEIAQDFRALLQERITVSEQNINPEYLYRKFFKYGEHLAQQGNAEAAKKAYWALSREDKSSEFGACAEWQLALLNGNGQEAAAKEAAYQRELRAAELRKQALAVLDQNRFDEALALLGNVLTEYQDTRIARDCAVCKGFVLIRAGRRDDAAVAFRDALTFNAPLPAWHPLNSQARTRLAALKHHEYYAQEYPEVSQSFYPILTNCDNLFRDIVDALPANTPERAHAAMQHAGLLFEMASNSRGTSVTWEIVRKELQSVLRDYPGASQQTRALAELMFLESFLDEEKYPECIRLCEEFEKKHRNLTREYGTAVNVKAVCYWRVDDYANAEKTYRRMKEEFPDGVEWFPTLHVKQTGELFYVNTYYKEQNYAEAEKYLQTVLKKYPDTLQTHRVIESRQRGTCEWP